MMLMIRPRTVVLIGAISLASGWMAGNIASPATQEAPAQRRSTGPRPLGGATSVAPYTAQLRQKLEEHPRSPRPGRNPFMFGSRPAAPIAPMSGAEARDVRPEERVFFLPPPAPAFKLSGIAASEKDGAVVLTAIVIDNGSMTLAKAGDKLSGGHSVLRIDEKSIVIVDAAGVEQIVRLP